jgi:type III secretion protein V
VPDDALRSSAAQFVGIQETQAMLDALEATHPALVRHVVPKPLGVTLLAEVLRRMAEERVSIRNLRDVLESLHGQRHLRVHCLAQELLKLRHLFLGEALRGIRPVHVPKRDRDVHQQA